MKHKYIWINPVVDKMYDKNELQLILEELSLKRVEVTKDYIQIVKEKYRLAIQEKNRTQNEKYKSIIDMRCPMARDYVEELLEQNENSREVIFPDIEPILIHCAREISENEAYKGIEKIITTPCRALADMGNRLCLEETVFYSWIDFIDKIESEKKLDSTPIPLGFFADVVPRVISLTDKDNIKDFFKEAKSKDFDLDYDLIEMLYCHNGCHNGDGVKREDE